LLPKQAAIVGIRQGNYTLSGNKFLPGATSVQRVILPGNPSWNVNLPQDSLELSGKASGSINANKFRLGCLPDEMADRGEYAPSSTYTQKVQAYLATLMAAGTDWGFVGRVLSNPTARVISITPGANGVADVVLSAAIGAVAGVDYIRFNRVYDEEGNPVKGAYFIAAAAAGFHYTIAGFTGQTVQKPSGLARVDQIAFFKYGTIQVNRAVVKKIGRPSSSYRGRASRKTAV